MNFLILLTFLISWSSCGPTDTSGRSTGQGSGETASPIPILSYENDTPDLGSYNYKFESGNGISVQERGFSKLRNDSHVAGGTYSYTAPTGELIVVTWHADENGFRAKQRIMPKGSDMEEYNPEDLLHGPFQESIERETIQGGREGIEVTWHVDENGLHSEWSGWSVHSGFRPIG